MPCTLVIGNLRSRQQRLEFHFFYHSLEWQRYLVGNLGTVTFTQVLVGYLYVLLPLSCKILNWCCKKEVTATLAEFST